ncbi:MAG TPA: glucan ABC transporter ATP-binding protein/ permease [Polyangiaceae bacterium]|jgi:ATP-binding cassette subfamily B protein|nr:glucan ABC transporter ATP-binding protein/ permease [Polyangiaceae bacterium]
MARQFFRVYRRVFAELRPERGLAWVLFFANVVLAVAQFAEPWFFGRIIDALGRATLSNWVSVLSRWVLAWIAVGLFNIGGSVAVALHADRLSHRRRLAITTHYFRHVLSLPLSFHAGMHSGRVLKVMSSGAEAMWNVWLNFFRTHCAPLLSLFVLLPCCMMFDTRLGLLMMALVGTFAFGMWRLMNATFSRQNVVNEEHAALSEHAADAIGNLAVVQSFTRVEAEIRTLDVIGARFLAAQMPVLSYWAAGTVATRAASTLTVTAVLIVGTLLHLRGEATVGQIVACMGLAASLVGRLEATLTFLTSLVSESPKIAEFFDVIDKVPAVRDDPGAKSGVVFQGDVAFENVSFDYPNGRRALENVSFRATAGETVALVGSTGSGKSTTLALLYRAYDPIAGRITLDGADARSYALDTLRGNIAVVFQEPLLFARSVRENLWVGKAGATDAEMWDALERAQARDVIERLPDGLGTILSERGRSLSGGERQRLSIARALLKAPPILILDEATAALDAITESKLSIALAEVMRGRTTFVIAHRLSTIRKADRVLVLEGGRIVESGAFDELVSAGGRFAELARAQLGSGVIAAQ